jgi:pimeloyl-ACP methyl ester carboxylesterase
MKYPVTRPIVILGGMLSSPQHYRDMRTTLAELTGRPVHVVPVFGHDWLGMMSRAGWAHVLRKLVRVVEQARAESPGEKITLVGHSAGGVIGRVYLGAQPFLGQVYDGARYVDSLITLGSPHYTHQRMPTWRWVEDHYPRVCCAPAVRYACVAGAALHGSLRGSAQEGMAYSVYRPLCGDGLAWGDGLVPVRSALLEGAQHFVMDGVGHSGSFRRVWYGTPDVVRQWWRACGEMDG